MDNGLDIILGPNIEHKQNLALGLGRDTNTWVAYSQC